MAFLAFLLCVAVVPQLTDTPWSPHQAVMFVIGAAGIPLLFARALGYGRAEWGAPTVWAARFALGFLVAGFLSALLSAKPSLAFVGLFEWGTGWGFMVALAGAWALGSGLGDQGREILERALIVGAVVNAVVAILQETVGLGSIGIPMAAAQANGLLGNPVYLGALLVGALALLAPRIRTDLRRWWLPVVVVSVGLGMTGERLPSLVAVIVVVWALVSAFRARPADAGAGSGARRRLIGFAVLTGLGGVVGSQAGQWLHGFGVASSLASSNTGGLYSDRFEAWRVAAQVLPHRIFLGYGPGQFRAATLAHFPLAFDRAHPAGFFSDAHNFIVEYAVTTGVIGLGFFLVWVGLSFWQRRGPLVGFAAVLLLTGLAEPLNIVVTTLAVLALGAARPRRAAADPVERLSGEAELGVADWTFPLRRACVAGGLVGVLLGAALVTGDILYTKSAAQFAVGEDASALRYGNAANFLLRYWPEPASLLGQIHVITGTAAGHPGGVTLGEIARPGQGRLDPAIGWFQVAARRDPTNGGLWNQVAGLQASAGEDGPAYQSALRAEQYSPWNPNILRNLATIAAGRHDTVAERHWLTLYLEVEPNATWARQDLTQGCAATAVNGFHGPNSGIC